MRLVSAKFFRLLSHSARAQKETEKILKEFNFQEFVLRKNPALIHDVYDHVMESAKEGNGRLKLPDNHLLWQTPEVQKFFTEKGFEVKKESHSIHWDK